MEKFYQFVGDRKKFFRNVYFVYKWKISVHKWKIHKDFKKYHWE